MQLAFLIPKRHTSNHQCRKWESFAFLPVDNDDDEPSKNKKDNNSKKDDGKDFYLISFSDNDFITQNGTFFSCRKSFLFFLQ
jgi:hypothetical protein